MKKTLIIGSTVLDMIVKIDHVPILKEDMNTQSMGFSLGGMAYNVNHIHQRFNVPSILCCAAGHGFFADCVVRMMKENKMEPLVRVPNMDNGCCLCLVEKSGERTFISHHGAEYTFDPAWLDDVDFNDIDMIYISGLEVEEPTGELLVQFLEKHQEKQLFFAPGPRINAIQEDRLKRIFQLSPVLHMNEQEVMEYTGILDYHKGAIVLQSLTKNTVMITCSDQGAWLLDKGEGIMIPTQKVVVVDTIGAGDSHIGSVMACLKLGMSFKEAVYHANCVAAKVVQCQGAVLSQAQFDEIQT